MLNLVVVCIKNQPSREPTKSRAWKWSSVDIGDEWCEYDNVHELWWVENLLSNKTILNHKKCIHISWNIIVKKKKNSLICVKCTNPDLNHGWLSFQANMLLCELWRRSECGRNYFSSLWRNSTQCTQWVVIKLVHKWSPISHWLLLIVVGWATHVIGHVCVWVSVC